MNVSAEDYRILLRRDLYAFTERAFYELNPTTNFMHNWHLELVAAALEECRLGETTRLIINQPPRSLKSHCATVSFPAFLLGHDPTAQIICASYGQELANKHALDCRTILSSKWYQQAFPATKLSPERQALPEFMTTRLGFRLSTSVGGVLTGRGADFIIIDDPLKPDEALSETQRCAVNSWFANTLYSRLNDKRAGRIILIMQRLHEDDLVGHILAMEKWKLIRLPAIADCDETHAIQTPYGIKLHERKAGEALHPEREPLQVLQHLREVQGEYNFAGQYQQAPAPLDGGMIKASWFKSYRSNEVPSKFEMILQSWDTANKATELSDYSVCTTWGVKEKHLFLLNVYRKRVGYPELKRAVREQAVLFSPQTILIEDKASGTQLIQELVGEGIYQIKRYEPAMDKIMRMHSVTSMIENGFVHLPENTEWLAEYLHELTVFPKGKNDDQADSTSQGLDWFKSSSAKLVYGLLDYLKNEKERTSSGAESRKIPDSVSCSGCGGTMAQRVSGGLRCQQCGAQWHPPAPPRFQLSRGDILARRDPFRLR